MAAYLEAHIEQGPRLENERKTVGVVTGIQGCRWFTIEVLGDEAHAGTTPIAVRKDALRRALDMIAAIQDIMADESDTVRFTVGRMEVYPNSPNTVPSRVLFTIDFRHPDLAVLTDLGDQIAAICEAKAAGQRGHRSRDLQCAANDVRSAHRRSCPRRHAPPRLSGDGYRLGGRCTTPST